MMVHPLAGKEVNEENFLDVPSLISQYYTGKPDLSETSQRVSFGTSGHRGSSLNNSFNEEHILAITQSICNYRRKQGIEGPLFMGRDTHALSEPAHETALEVLAANDIQTFIAVNRDFTPTPVISHAILTYNKERKSGFADGIVVTPSHNPPTDGGFKYNGINGGPADTTATKWIADEANRLLEGKNSEVRRFPLAKAKTHGTIKEYDYRTPYIQDLQNIVNMDIIRESGIRIGADALGGAGVHYWVPIAEYYGIDLTLLNGHPEPDFRFMRFDHDGKIRMDCSSPYAMAGLIGLKDDYDIAYGNDPDFDRHGIVTPDGGLMNPNHYLSVAIDYLFRSRTGWRKDSAVGKTAVSSSIIDRVAARLGRKLVEVPVGFKWFVPGLLTGELGFGGEESAGASFLRKDGTVWSTDKDGIIMALLAAEITAKTGRTPSAHYADMEAEFGKSCYARVDSPCSLEQKKKISMLKPSSIAVKTLAGEKIEHIVIKAPGNQAPLGGIKVVTANGWFAVRPSGTENISKLYAESLLGLEHLKKIQQEAQKLLS